MQIAEAQAKANDRLEQEAKSGTRNDVLAAIETASRVGLSLDAIEIHKSTWTKRESDARAALKLSVQARPFQQQAFSLAESKVCHLLGGTILL